MYGIYNSGLCRVYETLVYVSDFQVHYRVVKVRVLNVLLYVICIIILNLVLTTNVCGNNLQTVFKSLLYFLIKILSTTVIGGSKWLPIGKKSSYRKNKFPIGRASYRN
jgi:hypothetical protein